jgi:hypothetical protein
MGKFGTLAAISTLALIIGCNSSSAGTSQDTGTSHSTGGSSAGGVANQSTGGTAPVGGSATDSGGLGNTGTGDSAAVGGTSVVTGGVGNIGTSGTLAVGGNAPATGGASTQSTGGALGVGGSTAATGGALNTATGGMAAVGGSGGAGDCNMPLCLFNMYTACPGPSTGACTIQSETTATTSKTGTCYSNGTKAFSTMDLTTFVTTMIFENGSTVCYSQDIKLTGSGTTAISATTHKDGAGNVVATSTWDETTHVTTVTCTGGQPIVLNSACDDSTSVMLNCAAGVCTP